MWNWDPELRIGRALTQNLFLIETIPSFNEYKKQFAVMGSTGNVYTVAIKSEPTCSCPDFLKRRQNCKHIYFILLKVMKVKDVDQDYFEDSDLKEMFSKIPKITSNLIVDKSLRKLYKKQYGADSEDEGELKSQQKEGESKVRRQPIDDVCPICLEDLKEDEKELDYCKYRCGKSIHVKCFSMYCKINKKICVFCRAEWDKEENKIELLSHNRSISVSNLYNAYRGDYMNLLDIQNESQYNQLSQSNRHFNNIYLSEGTNRSPNHSTYTLRNTRIKFKRNYHSYDKDYEDEYKVEDSVYEYKQENDKEFSDIAKEGVHEDEFEINRSLRKQVKILKTKKIKTKEKIIEKKKTAFAFFEDEQLKKKEKGRYKSIAKKKEEIKQKWRKLKEIQKMKFEKMADDDKHRYGQEKRENFEHKNKQNKKRGRKMELEKKNLTNNDKRVKSTRGRKKVILEGEDEEN